jgi:heme ABC exporter ATP-binding subunit CcmA
VNAVSLVDLEKRYGRARALHGVQLEIAQGSSVLVAGPNGAGKSTLLRLAAGLARPTRGSVRVLGIDPFSPQAASIRARVGYLGMKPGLYGELTVRENLAFCARLCAKPAQAVDRAIERLDLTDRAQTLLHALSFGYQRRAGLARVLLADPELLLLDEPWNGLDDRAADRLGELLREVCASGTTVVVAAHGIGARGSLFERTLRLADGRLETA